MATPLTLEMVVAIMPNAISNGLREEFRYLLETCRRFEINTKNRVAAFLANVAGESGELYYVEEIADGWDYEGRQDLGNTQEGDGPRFKGHGYIQITGRNNHYVVGKALGVDAVSNPTILAQMPYAWYSAGWYWRNGSSWGNLNDYADEGNFDKTVMGVRGGPDSNRTHYWWDAMQALPDDLTIPSPTGIDTEGEKSVVTGQDIANSCIKIAKAGAAYRTWYWGASLPMWLDDGVNVPSVEYLMQNGVMCADLLDFARVDNGLEPVGGTDAYDAFVTEKVAFDPAAPGIVGAVAGSPYQGASLEYQGHVLLYTGAHSVVQALFSDGVTERYTDYETADFLSLTYYGFMPDVDYSGSPDVSDSPRLVLPPRWISIGAEGSMVAEGADYSRGWYDTGYKKGDWSFHGPKES